MSIFPPVHNSRRGHRGRQRRPVVVAMLLAALLCPPAGPLAGDEGSERLERYEEPVDACIDKALKYLAAHQHDKNGSFPSGRSTVAITGLSVMAFLAKGYTPGTGPYGETINRGIDYVLSKQDPHGVFPGEMYTHSIATLLLSEVSGMVDRQRQKKVDQALAKALKVIVSAQKVSKPKRYRGGWRYSPNSKDSDLSLTGWALMSLRSARNNGAEVPKASIDAAVGFIENCHTKDGGYGYQPGRGASLAMTGVGLLCLELSGQHRSKATTTAGDWVNKHLPKKIGGRFFYYGLYYTSQGMFQLGGERWEVFAAHMYEMMLKAQRKDGSFPQGTAQEAQAGRCYSTAMAVLAMSVTYRQLPIYQR